MTRASRRSPDILHERERERERERGRVESETKSVAAAAREKERERGTQRATLWSTERGRNGGKERERNLCRVGSAYALAVARPLTRTQASSLFFRLFFALHPRPPSLSPSISPSPALRASRAKREIRTLPRKRSYARLVPVYMYIPTRTPTRITYIQRSTARARLRVSVAQRRRKVVIDEIVSALHTARASREKEIGF